MRLTSAAARLVSAAALVTSMAVGAVPASAEDAPPLAAATDAGRVAAYVQAVYEDLFGREPDAGGAAAWTRALLAGTPRVAVANSITSSEEFRSGLISDVYEDYLGRGPDGGGLRFWLGEMARGRTIAQMQSGFIASDEYWNAAGGTPGGWVTALYQDVLERDPAAEEVGYWVPRIGAGATRGQVALGFLLSTEHLSTVVDGYYEWLLGRGLDPVGQRSWVGILQAGGRDEAIIGGIVGSDEYWGLVTEHPGIASLSIVAPDGPIPAGPAVTFAVRGLDARGRVVADLTDAAPLALDGRASACVKGLCDMSTMVGPHTMRATWGTLTTTTTVAVVVGKVSTIWVNASAPAITAGVAFQVRVTGVDAGGNVVAPLTPVVTVDAGGSCVGTTCTITSSGPHALTATVGDVQATAGVTIEPAALARLELSPSSATVTAGASQAYRVRGHDRFGNEVPYVGVRTTFTVDGVVCPGGACAPSGLGSHAVTATSAGVSASAAISVVAAGPTASRLYGWGAGSLLGTGGGWGAPVTPPTQVGVDTHWTTVSSSGAHTLGITSDGALWSWGIDPVGDGIDEALTSPVHLGTDRWSAVAALENHVLAVRQDGSLWTWGYDSYGTLGFEPAFQATPTRVGTRNDWVAAAGTASSSAALTSDGRLWTWGDNLQGQLGTGSGVNATAPVEVAGSHRWRAVAGGCSHMVAIAQDGTLWAWGSNWYGELGLGTNVDVAIPTQVGTAATWATVSAGCNYSAATRTDGSLWTWGENGWGQLGTGDRIRRSTPTQVGVGTTWTAVSAGGATTHGLSAGGALWGWGENGSHQAIGAPSQVDLPVSPTRIGTDTGWTAITGGGQAAFALRP